MVDEDYLFDLYTDWTIEDYGLTAEGYCGLSEKEFQDWLNDHWKEVQLPLELSVDSILRLRPGFIEIKYGTNG